MLLILVLLPLLTMFILFQVVLLNVYDVMIKAVMVVPRVETKLYSEWVSLQTITYSIGVLW